MTAKDIRPIRTLLVANRGEIACRVMRTARAMGIGTVAVHSDADAAALHVAMADRAVRLGPAPAAQSYLLGDGVIAAALAAGADAVHPGYGFLSENADFAEAVEAAGLVWVGPPAAAIRAMGLKGEAKRLMEAAGVPVVPGYHGAAQDDATLAAEAERVGYPVLIKAVAGGGGKGMREVAGPDEFRDALASARREGAKSFGDDRVLVERLVASPRHVEIQVFADAHGNAIHLGERDCSLQRRHQKVIEESPAPGITPAIREAMGEAGVRAATAVGYRGAGTVEFIVDGERFAAAARGEADPAGCFHFMEMNTRLQVEHPVTEAVTGLDLVAWQLRIAMGEALPLSQDEVRITGHAVEARLYAEDVGAGFLPSTGTLHRLDLPATGEGARADTAESARADTRESVRVDTGVMPGDEVTGHYDPMIAKLIAHADTREEALRALGDALARETRIAGPVTNAPFLRRLLRDGDVVAGRVDTGLIARAGERLAADPAPDGAIWLLAALVSGDMLPERPHAGFRLWGRARSHVTLMAGGEPRTLAVVGPDAHGAYALEGAPETLTIHACEPMAGAGPDAVRTLRVEAAAGREGEALRRATAAVATLHPGARSGERALTLHAHGEVYRFVLPDPLAGRAAGDAGGDAVLAPMPGTLIALDVAEGDVVEAGQRIAVLEAMKMEHALRAPRGGTIATVAASLGANVAAGDAVVTLEVEPAS